MKPRRPHLTNHRLALFPIAVMIGVVAFIAWAAISLAQPPIPHTGPTAPEGPGEFADCLFCHQSGIVGSPRVVSDHLAYRNEDCLTCHEYLMHPDEAFAHSGLLVGGHAELWCEDCHGGVQRPGSQCADCHEPLTVPHFGTVCEDCHTPEGFEGTDAGDFEHPLALEGAHATLACSDCHVAGQELTSDCAECHQPPSEPHFGTVCQDCHTPAGFGDVDVTAFEHPVALEGEHAQVACASCHTPGHELTYDCAECHQPPSEPHFATVCQDCHTPAGFNEVDVGALDHPVTLEGAHVALACSDCHTADQELVYECAECHEPPSQPHFGQTCENCHTPEGFKQAGLAASEHPVALVGNHATLACSSCHTGDRELTYECAECHEPPSQPHFGQTCENCHTPEGFEQAGLADSEHPVALVGSHVALACSRCHTGSEELTYECARCHEPPSEPHFGTMCEDCHTPAGFKDVELSAFVHPVALEGAHAALACSSCHTAGRQVTYDCAGCHQPPSEPHYGTICQSCHTPAGFKNVDLSALVHPVALEGAHAELACSNCHTAGRELVYDCAECHQPPSRPHFGAVCQDCHTPDGFEDADAGAVEHPVALEGAHAELACSNCHTGNQELTYECSECHEPPGEPHFGSVCQNCHTPAGWSESAESVGDEAEEIPHELEGREDCLLCHDPEGQVEPAPSSHVDYINDQCLICHETES